MICTINFQYQQWKNSLRLKALFKFQLWFVFLWYGKNWELEGSRDFNTICFVIEAVTMVPGVELPSLGWGIVQSSLGTLIRPVVKLSQTLGPPSSVWHLLHRGDHMDSATYIYGLLRVLPQPSTIWHSRDPIKSTETWLGCVGLKTASINIKRYLGSSAFLVPHGKVSQCSAKLKNSQFSVTYMCLWENKWGFTINVWNQWDSGFGFSLPHL